MECHGACSLPPRDTPLHARATVTLPNVERRFIEALPKGLQGLNATSMNQYVELVLAVAEGNRVHLIATRARWVLLRERCAVIVQRSAAGDAVAQRDKDTDHVMLIDVLVVAAILGVARLSAAPRFAACGGS